MIVTKAGFDEVVRVLSDFQILVVDTETTGLRPDHGDRLFSIVVGALHGVYYFNFNGHGDPPDDCLLGDEHLRALNDRLFNAHEYRTWVGHNLKFDATVLAASGITLKGQLYDTKVGARVEFNDHFDYSLDAVAERIGSHKSDAVAEYIKAHKLIDEVVTPFGIEKKPRYDLVPLDIMVAYAEQDVRATWDVYRHQQQHFADAAKGAHPLCAVVKSELALTPVVYAMERRGVRIDRDYCEEASAFERGRMGAATEAFEAIVGAPFLDSGVYFAKHMQPSGMLSKKTQKSSYCAEALERMAGHGDGAAKTILEYRDAKKRLDLYQGLLYHCDSSSTLHANFDQAGTKTGRFSCSSPNLQQLSKDDVVDDASYPVRRAIRPRPGHVFLMLDFDQQEYRLMLDYARLYVPYSALIEKVLGGLDVHQATADIASITRREAKTVNFSILFGSGAPLLASRLGISQQEARRLKYRVLDAEPGIRAFLDACERTARHRGYVTNWHGRRWYCPDPRFAYRAPNFICQGGGADVVKVAMTRIAAWLPGEGGHIVLQLHDELVLEVPEDSALRLAKRAKETMEGVYPYRFLPLTVGVDWSPRSLADKEELVL